MVTLLVYFVISQQWSTPVNLGISGIADIYPQTHRSQQWWTDSLCLMWQAFQDDNWEIYSRFSTGSAWSDTIRVTNDPSDDIHPSVTYDPYLHRFWCVWERDGDIYASYYQSPSWSIPEAITSGPAYDQDPSIFCQDSFVRVVWQRTINDSTNIYASYRVLYSSWATPVPITQDQGIPNVTPKLNAGNNYAIAVWQHGDDIYYSTNSSNYWTAPQAITTTSAQEMFPDVNSFDNGSVCICWQSDSTGDYEIYRTAVDTFTTYYRVTNNTADDWNPCPLFYTIPILQWEIPMILFASRRNGNFDIFSWLDWSGAVPVDTDPGQDINPVCTANFDVYIWALWQSDRNGDWDIYGSYQFNPGSVAESGEDLAVPWCTVIPNPFRTETRIAYGVRRTTADNTEIRIYDIAGMLVKCCPRSTHDALRCTIIWDGTDHSGHPVAPGVYFVRIETDQGVFPRKIIKID